MSSREPTDDERLSQYAREQRRADDERGMRIRAEAKVSELQAEIERLTTVCGNQTAAATAAYAREVALTQAAGARAKEVVDSWAKIIDMAAARNAESDKADTLRARVAELEGAAKDADAQCRHLGLTPGTWLSSVRDEREALVIINELLVCLGVATKPLRPTLPSTASPTAPLDASTTREPYRDQVIKRDGDRWLHVYPSTGGHVWSTAFSDAKRFTTSEAVEVAGKLSFPETIESVRVPK